MDRQSRTVGVLVVAVSVLLSAFAVMAVAGELPPGGTFSDDNGNIHEGNIEAIAAQGITKGCNPPANDEYCPSSSVTRGQMAAFLVRALDLPATSTDFFSDDDGTVFEENTNRLAAAGVTKGCNPPVNDRYCPDGNVTRGQMAAFLVRAFGYSDTGGVGSFVDTAGSVFALDIDRLAAAGVTSGCNPPENNRYCPNDEVKRDQMASFLARALGLSPIVPPAATPDLAYTMLETGVSPAWPDWQAGVGIMVSDADGTGQVRLSNEGFEPQVSPDGTLIAFWIGCIPIEIEDCGDLIPPIRIIGVDGTGEIDFDVSRVNAGVHRKSLGFSWNPTSTGLVFDDAWPENGNDRGIWAMNLDGSAAREIVSDPNVLEHHPVVSPDGKYVAYMAAGLVDELRVADYLTGEVLWTSGSGVPRVYEWTAGGQLMYTRNVTGFGRTALGVVHPEATKWGTFQTSTLLQVTGYDAIGDIALSPDSVHDADSYLAITGGVVYVVGGELRRMNFVPPVPETLSAAGSDVSSVTWLRDGTHLAYASGATDASEVYVLDLTTGAVVPISQNGGGSPDAVPGP